MAIKDTTWDDEYRARYYASERVQVHLELFREHARQPKSLETREKMSASHKNRKKSESHKQSLSEAQRERHAIRRELAKLHPGLTLSEQWKLVRDYLNGQVHDHNQS